MADIILDSRRIKVYEDLRYLCEVLGHDDEYLEKLWGGILSSPELYDEILYYIDNRCLKDQLKYEGYSLTDLYVYALENSNLYFDIGKNSEQCNKDGLVLDTFMLMVRLIENPEEMKKRLDEGRWMDKL